MIVSLVVLNMKRPISVHLLTEIEDRRHNMGSKPDDRQGHSQLGFLFLTICQTERMLISDLSRWATSQELFVYRRICESQLVEVDVGSDKKIYILLKWKRIRTHPIGRGMREPDTRPGKSVVIPFLYNFSGIDTLLYSSIQAVMTLFCFQISYSHHFSANGSISSRMLLRISSLSSIM